MYGINKMSLYKNMPMTRRIKPGICKKKFKEHKPESKQLEIKLSVKPSKLNYSRKKLVTIWQALLHT